MFSDITIPNNNELEFVEVALKLNLSNLYLLYKSDKEELGKIKKKLALIQHSSKLNIGTGFIVNEKNIREVSRHSNLLVVKSSDKDREYINGKRAKLIYGFEENSKRDFMSQKASGLNHILCELVRKNNIIIGFSYSQLFNKDGQISSLLIGRMIQNIRLCRKYKVKTVIGCFSEEPYDMRSAYDISSLFTLLGMESKAIKESTSYTF